MIRSDEFIILDDCGWSVNRYTGTGKKESPTEYSPSARTSWANVCQCAGCERGSIVYRCEIESSSACQSSQPISESRKADTRQNFVYTFEEKKNRNKRRQPVAQRERRANVETETKCTKILIDAWCGVNSLSVPSSVLPSSIRTTGRVNEARRNVFGFGCSIFIIFS